MNSIDIEEVKMNARGRWLEILGNLAPQLQDAIDKMPKHVPCPVNGGKDGFRLFKDAAETGGGVSNAEGGFSNGFSLLMWVLDSEFIDVLKSVNEYVNGCYQSSSHVYVPKNKVTIKELEVNFDKRREKCRAMWIDSAEIWDDSAFIARKYFLGRGINIYLIDESYLKNIRFHKGLDYWQDNKNVGKFPCIISLVSYPDGSGATLHRTYLDKDGKKLNIDVNGSKVSAKKLMARVSSKPLTGSSIRLGDAVDFEEIHVAEGLETALSVIQAINKPVWVCVSSTLLEGFQPPDQVRAIHVWMDKDASKAGEKSTMKLENRMTLQQIDVIRHSPSMEIPSTKKGIDWNDVLVGFGSTEIKKELE